MYRLGTWSAKDQDRRYPTHLQRLQPFSVMDVCNLTDLEAAQATVAAVEAMNSKSGI